MSVYWSPQVIESRGFGLLHPRSDSICTILKMIEVHDSAEIVGGQLLVSAIKTAERFVANKSGPTAVGTPGTNDEVAER